MKFFKRWMFLLLILIAAAFAVERILLPPARLRGMIERQVSQRLHREIKLEGIHPGFTGLTIDHLRLSEEPNFRAGTFLVAEGVSLEWSLRAFLLSLRWGHLLPSQWEGNITIRHAVAPFYDAHDVSIDWHLTDVDPTLAHLNGRVKFRQGTAVVQNLDRLSADNKSLGLVLMPLQLLQSLGKMGVVNLNLPNLSHWVIDGITGDYRFVKGVMKIDRFLVASAELSMSATGDIVLPTRRVAVQVDLHSPKRSLMGQMDLKVGLTGTIDHPNADLTSLKKQAFKATVQGLLNNPAARQGLQQQLQKIFH